MISRWIVIVSLLIVAQQPANGQQSAAAGIDASRVVGHEQCTKCHQSEVTTWLKTPHAQTFETLHRKPEANEIAKRLGLTSIKRNDVCIQCHYTQQEQHQKIKAVAGVSCESCHGAAADWLEQHADYGGPHVTRAQESTDHRARRRELSIAKGMRNPVNLYLVAQSCLNCHTTPNEDLVNVGGHKAGTLEFELVSWSQGRVRHNYVRSQGKQNEVSAPDRLRVMYLVGIMADLEYSLRATAKATQKGTFGITSAQRSDRLRKKLQEVQSLAQHPLVQPAIDAATPVKLKLNNEAELLAAADAVGQAAFAFAEHADGSELAAIDRLIPDPKAYK